MRRGCAILLACSALSLAPCVAAPPATEPPADSPVYGVYPIAYRDLVLKFLESRLLDPASAQIEWGEPQPGKIKTPEGDLAGYAIVITVNSRNKFGMYTGKQKYRLLIRNGEIVHGGRA